MALANELALKRRAIQEARGMAAAPRPRYHPPRHQAGHLMLAKAGVVQVLDPRSGEWIESTGTLGSQGPVFDADRRLHGGPSTHRPCEGRLDAKKDTTPRPTYSRVAPWTSSLTDASAVETEKVLKKLMVIQTRRPETLHAARSDIPEALEEAYKA